MRTSTLSGLRLLTVSLIVFATTHLYGQTQTVTKEYCAPSKKIYNADSARFGVMASLAVNGNGLGSQISPQLVFTRRNFLISSGPALQLSSGNVAGVKLNVQYELSMLSLDPVAEPSLRLFAFINTGYYFNGKLGTSARNVEHRAKPDNQVDYSSVTLKALDVYAGLGVNWYINDRVMWMNGIGGGYNSILSSTTPLYRDNRNMGIMLRTAICYRF